MAILDASDRTADEVESSVRANGALPIPPGDLLPIVAIPTTLAGADLSAVGSVTLPETSPGVSTDDHHVGGFGDERLMPDAVFYDPALFGTTPDSVLNASAMNGFDKGIELLYSRNATPITDATAKHGLGLLGDALPAMTADRSALEQSIVGTILVQYGLSTPGTGKLSIIHAFGHGLARHYPVQQGAVHGIVAPAVLEYVFESVDGRRTEIATALGVEADETGTAQSIVQAVAQLRDDLGLPHRLRQIEGLEPDSFPEIAAFILDDGIMRNRPSGLDPTQSEIEGVLESLW
jgi:alcohol dehydrogenase